MDSYKNPTKLEYYDDMWSRQCTATLLSHFKTCFDIGSYNILSARRRSTRGYWLSTHSWLRKQVSGFYVRSKDGIVFHYGFFENGGGEFEPTQEKGNEVSLFVDEQRRKLNSRFLKFARRRG